MTEQRGLVVATAYREASIQHISSALTQMRFFRSYTSHWILPLPIVAPKL